MTDINANDRQVGGDHYKQFEIDPWDAIAVFCPKNLVGVEIYLWGCAFKYLVRFGAKSSPLEDLEKTEHYLQKLRETLEKKLAGRVTTTENQISHHKATIDPHAEIAFKAPVIPQPAIPQPESISAGYQPYATKGRQPEPPGKD